MLTYEGTYEKPIYKTLPDQLRNELEAPLSEDELKSSLRGRKNGSALGISGFTARWVKRFWIHIKQAYIDQVKQSHEEELLPQMQRYGMVKQLPKGKKDRSKLGNLETHETHETHETRKPGNL